LSLSQAAVDKAADFLVTARRAHKRIDEIPEDCRPTDFADATAVYEAVQKKLGAKTVGWKAGFSAPSQIKQFKLDGPLFARLSEGQVFPSPATIPFARFHAPLWEVEVAFKMAKTLSPRPQPFSRDEVLAAVSAAHLCFEIPDVRFTTGPKTPLPSLVADSFATAGFVVGPEIPNWRSIALDGFPAELVINGAVKAGTVPPENRSDPIYVLHGVANQLRARGVALEAGHVITTGSATTPTPAQPGDVAIGRIVGGPEVSATLAV
jgi:2-keto-4-pentenoate hydratase